MFAATGAAVTDLEKATAFYVEVFGMKNLQSFDLEDMTENILGSGKPGQASLVLMQYKNRAKPAHDTEATKFVFYVRDAAATAEAVVAAGGTITREPIAFEGSLVGFATDLDGYLLELLQVQKPSP